MQDSAPIDVSPYLLYFRLCSGPKFLHLFFRFVTSVHEFTGFPWFLPLVCERASRESAFVLQGHRSQSYQEHGSSFM